MIDVEFQFVWSRYVHNETCLILLCCCFYQFIGANWARVTYNKYKLYSCLCTQYCFITTFVWKVDHYRWLLYSPGISTWASVLLHKCIVQSSIKIFVHRDLERKLCATPIRNIRCINTCIFIYTYITLLMNFIVNIVMYIRLLYYNCCMVNRLCGILSIFILSFLCK